MNRKLSYKNRFYLLLAFAFLLIIAFYKLTISPTIQVKRNLNDIHIKLNQLNSAPKNIADLEKKIAIINNILGENENNTAEFQWKLLDQISTYCTENSLILNSFPQVHIYKKIDYQLLTCYASVEGTFIPLLKLLSKIESSFNDGRIISVDFTSHDDRRSKRRQLIMSIYIQTIKQAYNE